MRIGWYSPVQVACVLLVLRGVVMIYEPAAWVLAGAIGIAVTIGLELSNVDSDQGS